MSRKHTHESRKQVSVSRKRKHVSRKRTRVSRKQVSVCKRVSHNVPRAWHAARARRVLPVPGGPNSSTPFGGSTPGGSAVIKNVMKVFSSLHGYLAHKKQRSPRTLQ